MMKKSNLMPAIVLSTICIVVALLLAAVNMITAPIIEANMNSEANQALIEVLPGGKNFKEIELTNEYPKEVTAGYTADGGFVFQMTVTGKSAGLIVMCGIDDNGKVVATKVIASEETPDYAQKVFPEVEGTEGKYSGMVLDGFAPYLVSGATLTSKAYGDAIKAALQAAVLAGGGEVDTRTPEQILQDNCNEALGTEGKTFTRWFATEIITGIDKIYVAGDNAGYVFVIGETFVGVNDSGVATQGATAENSDKASAAYSTIKASKLTAITALPAGVDKQLVSKAFVTESGNYVFELFGPGYSAYYGTPISIKVCISADGAIVDCLTVKHRETKGYGDKCATEEYRDSWEGVVADDVVITVENPSEEESQIGKDCTDVGAISGATFTTFGYQTAIKAAFEAFELLTQEGGNQ